MTELSFLLELLLTHKLAKGTKEAITNRIKEIETRHIVFTQPAFPQQSIRQPRTAQAASTQRILDEMALEPQPAPPEQVAQSPAAAMALAARQEAINIALSGKEEKGRSSPRKF
jgi:hypothetical protein